MTETLLPAAELAARNPVRILNESAEYRAARQKLLIEEYELRRLTERVAEMRRALPPGAPVTGDYRFIAEDGREVSFAALFGDHRTLAIYNYMFGPQRARPCPMCTNLLGALEGNANDVMQQMALAVVARSPIEKLNAWKKERGWKALQLYSDANGNWSRDYHAVGDDGGDIPGLHVFTRRDGTIRHFWSGEMTEGDPGQDPRGAPELAPLWHMLDMRPEGRAPDWYPDLDYPK
ncbi:Predicted dithiol-disulfide oxidoreductase, DUF899 family [Kaistia soli DSM 19436]|uniref:Predicted dithiol-disulfide oxidoreductase, DUF899 family n=1 Tax=Kaistia soli DSM 19436 TaxID=1122133 RepID=A0A1M4W186_9HYPH|nr:DUF899 family protein [Kaistia soli]SHE74979.1 Predicted dithiol-disulfide oxidoreductase, DUF899 family [Kaistia soli DSM 19436]